MSRQILGQRLLYPFYGRVDDHYCSDFVGTHLDKRENRYRLFLSYLVSRTLSFGNGPILTALLLQNLCHPCLSDIGMAILLWNSFS
jgi:hypothetical protein